MHGSSSVPQDWLEVIREYGGTIRETYGVPVEEIRRGIANGVRKVNIDTDIRLAMTGAMRRVVREASRRLRSAQAAQGGDARREGHLRAPLRGVRLRRARASAIRPVPLDAMADRYARGDIGARVH